MASSARFIPDIQVQRLQQLGTSPTGPLYLYMLKNEALVETQAKRNVSGSMVNVRSGNLRSSIHSTTQVRGTKLVGTISADAAYALAVHNGTAAHDIVPVNGRVLAWEAPSGTAFATIVRHPGTKGKPFLTDALTVIKG